MKTLLEIKIFGETFIVSSEDEEKYVQELAAFVDQRMRRFEQQTKTSSLTPLRAAIMAAMSIADEHLKARKQEAEEAEKLERVSANLLSRLEQSEQADRGKSLESAKTHFVSLRVPQE